MKRLLLALTALLYATSFAAAQIVTGSVPNVFVNGTIIDATQVNADYNYIISQVNTNGAKNGANSDITALTALSTPIAPAAGGASEFVSGVAGGTANAITVSTTTPSITGFSLTAGYKVTFRAAATNTGAATLAVGSTAATNIVKQTPAGFVNLAGGEIVANEYATVIFGGTSYILIHDMTQGNGYGPLTSIAGAATVDLSTVYSRNAYITGTSFAVTSLGTPGTTDNYYMTTWNTSGTVTISNAAASLLNGASYKNVISGDRILWYWNGTNWFEIAYWPNIVKPAMSGANNVTIKNNATTPNTQVDVTATEVVLVTSGGGQMTKASYGTCTINLSTTGAGGLDAGSITTSTWYHVYAIGQATGGTVSCLASTSATAPTMPTGYAYFLRLGAVRTDGSSALYRTMQKGRKARFTLVTGSNTTTYYALATGSTAGALTAAAVVAPSTAVEVDGFLEVTGGSGMYVQANNSVGASRPANIAYSIGSSCAGCAANMPYEVLLESSNIYYGSYNASDVLYETGWVDQVNAN